MTIFRSQGPPFVPPHDNVTLPQFILDDVGVERTRRARPAHVPCLIDFKIGRAVCLEQARYNLGVMRVVLCSSRITSTTASSSGQYTGWARSSLRTARRSTFTADELAYQLEIAPPSLVVAYPGNLQVLSPLCHESAHHSRDSSRPPGRPPRSRRTIPVHRVSYRGERSYERHAPVTSGTSSSPGRRRRPLRSCASHQAPKAI
ncbi:hypothetical protein LXA43DRAFT_104426 [Ganoderma leucocontextum]|nr:hypothetical protein LXA43DRAFT_104426 [Ganoderma leucocontextum]